jgi:hypothetical protein
MHTMVQVGIGWFYVRRDTTPIRQRQPYLMMMVATLMTISLCCDVAALAQTNTYKCAAHVWNVSLPMTVVCTLYLWRAMQLVFSSRLARHRVSQSQPSNPLDCVAPLPTHFALPDYGICELVGPNSHRSVYVLNCIVCIYAPYRC